MSETSVHTGLAEPRFVILYSHVVQLVLAVIIMGLDGYGVRYEAYNALVCSLVVAVCTTVVCGYFIVSQCWLRRLYSPYITAAYHAWMLIFWVVDLGLVAHLAKLWEGPGCAYGYHNGYICSPFQRRSTSTDHRLPYNTYYGALIAGAVLAAFELALWSFTTILTFLHSMKRHRSANPSTLTRVPRVSCPQPAGIPIQNIEIPMDQIAAIAPWSVPVSPTESQRDPIIPDPDESVPCPGNFSSQPRHRFGSLGTLSDVPLSTHCESVPSKTSGPPRDTEQIDWSGRSSFYHTDFSVASLLSTDSGDGPGNMVRDV